MERMNITTEILDLEEARRRLSQVKPLAASIIATMTELEEVGRTLADEDTPEGGNGNALCGRLRRLEESFRASLAELNRLGAYLKDPTTGLLDFYSWRGDEMVFLCWRHGEDTIRHWHGLDEGFAGRKPLEA